MQKICDWCKKPVKKVGKLYKVEYLMLCKRCREKYKRSRETKKKGQRVWLGTKHIVRKVSGFFLKEPKEE